ncbi:MAG: tagatose-bisphosphate aldolase [Candidatus Harrisonbacteria bacterium CG10_big_fil_rev_8_21_14_0_10_49_15]|uniref:Tagatose-bisphosphate aldolase n=1 Tax=Candidatus Harrisonbacteria bacterium CG10_big_fil_rev_8_21_14_0_10_49_15 TaxID=1974587 RepID=A0A2H0UKF0_9BACT|nr:MAG: tagatose-bisphosphate aldolase [Candidatus Harrisonbacteria bacterium CG10_big_fil_rev_8_21_14_0_10_49_15]
MQTLRESLSWARENKVAIGHFNAADITMTKAVIESALDVSKDVGHKIPVIIGFSDGERDFFGIPEAVAYVRAAAKEYDHPIYINADHTATVQRSKDAVDADFDSVIIDAAKETLEDNIRATKEVVVYARGKASPALIEGEFGYIGSGSKVMDSLPEGAAITKDAIASVADSHRFVSETGVDLFAPAVGNVHGMLAKGKNPHLFIERIAEIREAVGVPLVLHGGSGVSDEDFTAAIAAGISIIHISTEMRRAWREGLEKGLADKPGEIAPYKVEPAAIDAMKAVITRRLRLFNNL